MRKVLVALCLVGCTGDAPTQMQGPPPLGPEPSTPLLSSIAGGSFAPIAPATNLAGHVLLARTLDGKTHVSLAISGVTASTMYTAHVHAAPCQFQGAGHYKIDPSVMTTSEPNELWIHGSSDAQGVLVAAADFQHIARGEALSVVVHDPASGAKVACADLLADEPAVLDLTGTLAPFSAATTTDQTITGTLAASRSAGGTSFSLSLSGLDPAALGYAAHVHAEPCSVTDAGGHYKIDPLVATTDQTNELWFAITAGGPTAASTLESGHTIRTDAQAIVLHRQTDNLVPPTMIKVACTNIVRTEPTQAYATAGDATAIPAGTLDLYGSAVLTRKLTGVTEVAVTITGLEPKSKFMGHVHNLPCSADPPGGSHYKFDKSITDSVDTNELWLTLDADSTGTAGALTWSASLADADAQSVVVHSGDGGRIACFDLNRTTASF